MANRLGDYSDYYDEAGLPLPSSAPSLPSELNTTGPASWQSGKLVEVPTDFSNIAPGTFGLNPATQQRDDDRELRDYVASLSSNTNSNRSLPGHVHTYRPGWDAQLKAQDNPLVFAPAMRESVGRLSDILSGKGVGPSEMGKRLLGIGQERYQTWPEQLVRSGFTLPHDVATGEVPVIDPATGHTSQQLIERAQDTAGLMGGGSFASTGEKAMAHADTAATAPLSALAKPAPRFYSAVERAVTESKTKVATAEQWLGEIRNKPGVKQEELDWVLHELPAGKITKPELEQFVQSHKVELKEVTKGTRDVPKYEVISDTTEDGAHSLKIKSSSGKIYDADRDAGSGHYEVLEMRQDKPGTVAGNLNVHTGSRPETLNEIKALITEYERGQNTTGEIMSGPKFAQYQLPGGENYREHLLTLPENTRSEAAKLRAEADRRGYGDRISDWPDKEFAKRYREVITNNPISDTFTSSHWSEPNVLAHIRTNERVIPPVAGGRNQPLNSLHVEEIQSDLHQAGRKQGYVGELEKLEPEFVKIDKKLMDTADESILANPELDDALKMAMDKGVITKAEAEVYKRYSKIEAEQAGDAKPVPDFPFKQNWPDLALKRIIRQAAEEGKDAISWTPGEAQALRYQNEIRQKLNAVDWHNKENGKVSPDGSKQILVTPSSGTEIILTVNKQGKIIGGRRELQGKQLDAVLGKDIASQIMEKGEGNIDAKGYVMNSAPMKAFYDKMVVDKMNALAKKFGGKVEESNLGETNPKGWHITPPDQTVSGKWMVKSNEYNSKGFHFDTEAEAKANLEQQIAGERTPKQPIHVLRITPQLRDAALSKGFSLFADTGKVGAPLAALSRVEHNPFTEQRAYHGTKTPGFDKFKKPDEDYMIDRMLGTHVAKDPEIANTFTGKSEFSFGRKVEGAAGGVYPVTIPHDAKFLNADPVKGAFDQTKIERMVMKTAFEKDPELLARYLEDARAVPKEDAVKLANDMVAGKKVTLPTDGPDYDLDRFISNFGGKPYRVADRAKAVEIFKKDAQDNGYAGIKYTNTSPGETANAKDKTSYIIFDTSKHLRNALTGQLMSDTSANAPLSALAKQHGVKLTPVESNPFTTDAYHGTRGFRGTEVEPKSGYAIHRDGYEFSVWDTTNRRTISPKFKSEAEANAWIDKRVGSELFSTSNPELADDYALGSQIMPLKLNTKDYHVFDAKGSNWQYANKHAIFEAEQLGKKGVVLKNVIDNNGVDRGPQTVYITLDPSTVRSKFAKFDPAKYGESGLLKASGLPIHQDKDGNQLMPIFTKEQYESMTLQPVKPGADVGSLKAVAVGAGKAAEWLAFLGSRNYPHINGPLTAAWIAQWPMMERMLKEDINKQLKAGKKPSEIEFSEGSIGDMFGIISSLRKKFGNDANRLTPVAHDPFNSR